MKKVTILVTKSQIQGSKKKGEEEQRRQEGARDTTIYFSFRVLLFSAIFFGCGSPAELGASFSIFAYMFSAQQAYRLGGLAQKGGKEEGGKGLFALFSSHIHFAARHILLLILLSL